MSESTPTPKETKKIQYDYEDNFSWDDCRDETVRDDIIFPMELNIHLRDKIRDLTSENGSLRRTLHETEEKLLEEMNKIKPEIPICNGTRDEEMKILQEKAAQANAKYHKCRNTCLTLRQELNKAQKLLCSEVGDSVTIAGLLNHPGGWRGRAEQIQHLNQKISELQYKLNDSEKSSRCSSVSVERRSLYRTKSAERERKEQIDHLGKELRQTEIALESNKKKFEAARARIKVLEKELSDAQKNYIILQDKGIHEAQLIDALHGQLKAVEDKYKEKLLDHKKQIERITCESSGIKNELHSSRLLIEQLRKKLSERETEINTLRSGTTRQTSSNNHNATVKNYEDIKISLGEKNYHEPNEYVIFGLAAEAERERLIEIVATLNRRLDKERSDTDHVSELLRRERTKNSKLENKIKKIEADRMKPRVNTGYRSRSSASVTDVNLSRDELQDDRLRYKLELLQEENLALKARLSTVQQEKALDLSAYNELLAKTKKIFHDSLRDKITRSGAHSIITV